MVEGDGGNSSGMSFSLTRKVGPLPVWGWCVIAIVAVFAYRHFHPTTNKADDTPTDATDTGAAGGAAAVSNNPGLATGMPPDNGDVSNYSNLGGNSWEAPTTNAEWKALALSKVASLNSWGAYQISNALSAYLGGSVLDSTQQPIVDTALKMVGPPPERIDVPNSIVPPPASSTIVLTQNSNLPTTMKSNSETINEMVRWTDKDHKPISGKLQMQWQNGAENAYINGKQIVVVNGTGTFFIRPGVVGTSHLRVTTLASDYEHAPAVSNVLTYTIHK